MGSQIGVLYISLIVADTLQAIGFGISVSTALPDYGESNALCSTQGVFIQVGAPDNGKMPDMNVFDFLATGIKFGGSGIGPPAQIEEMLQLAADKNIKPLVEVRDMKDANQVVQDMAAEKARYRYVLANN